MLHADKRPALLDHALPFLQQAEVLIHGFLVFERNPHQQSVAAAAPVGTRSGVLAEKLAAAKANGTPKPPKTPEKTVYPLAGINVKFIAKLNREFTKALFK